MKFYCELFAVAIVFFLCGCLFNKSSSGESTNKDRSWVLAMKIMSVEDYSKAEKMILLLDDVTALRIVAVSTQAASWPMEAGNDADFDNRMNDLSLAAIRRLAKIGSKESMESLKYAKRVFVMDGDTASFFKSLPE